MTSYASSPQGKIVTVEGKDLLCFEEKNQSLLLGLLVECKEKKEIVKEALIPAWIWVIAGGVVGGIMGYELRR